MLELLERHRCDVLGGRAKVLVLTARAHLGIGAGASDRIPPAGLADPFERCKHCRGGSSFRSRDRTPQTRAIGGRLGAMPSGAASLLGVVGYNAPMSISELLFSRAIRIAAVGFLAVPLSAQIVEAQLRPMGPVGLRDGGTYHVATGTWTRRAPTAAIVGTDVIYNNTAHTGFWFSGGIELETQPFEIWDFARLPLHPGVPGSSSYNISAIEFSYCLEDDSSAGELQMAFTLARQRPPCQPDPGVCGMTRYIVNYMPGADPALSAQGLPTCWTITLDLSGGGEFCIPADGDGVFDQDLDLDSMAMAISFDPFAHGGYLGSVAVGPVVAGDRSWTTKAGLEWTPTGGGGGGTVYEPNEICVPTQPARNSSGLDNGDGWWISDRPAQALPPGCYTLGGYSNGLGCNADGDFDGVMTPPASFYAVLYEDPGNLAECLCAPSRFRHFCYPAIPNSTAAPAVLTASLDPNAGSGVHLDVSSGPEGEFGYLVVGSNPETSNPLWVSAGLFCLSTSPGDWIGRYNIDSENRNSIGVFDSQGDFLNLFGTSSTGFGFDIPAVLPQVGNPTIQAGQTYHFQTWFRDNCGVGCSNFSNGVSVQF